jgi:ABC-type glycerol-3-phosphate transport system substrate-binding protein
MNTLKKLAALVALSVAGIGILAPAAQAAPQADTSITFMQHANSWEWT